MCQISPDQAKRLLQRLVRAGKLLQQQAGKATLYAPRPQNTGAPDDCPVPRQTATTRLALAHSTDLLCAEMVNLQRDQVDLAEKKPLAQRGTGRQDRIAPLDAARLCEALAETA